MSEYSQYGYAIMSRAQMLVYALLAVTFLLGLLSVVVGRARSEWRALAWWGWGSLIYGVGLGITQFNIIPRPWAAGIGNSLIAIAPVVSTFAVMLNTQRRLNWLMTGAALAATLFLIIINNIFFRLPALNFLGPSPLAMALFSFGAWAVWRHAVPEAGRAARFMASMMVFAVLVWGLRNAFILGLLGLSTDSEAADFIVSLFAIAQIIVGVAVTMAFFWIEVNRMQAALLRQALTDMLTSLPNRRAFLQRFEEESARARRQNAPLCLFLFDLDHFKRINDQHGHAVGDAVLRHVASVINDAKRTEDVLARLGGEEFACLLAADGSAAQQTAERLQTILANRPCTAGASSITITCSGGLAMLGTDGDDWDSLFARADARLYEAKQSGRNRVVAAG